MSKWTKVLVYAALGVLAAPPTRADEVSDLKAQVQSLLQRTNELQKQLQAVQLELHPLPSTTQQPQSPQPTARPTVGVEKSESGFMEHKPGKSLTFFTGSENGAGEITAYGNLDLSFDGSSKGISKVMGPDGPPVGKLGWMPAVSTNISYVGIRGFQTLGEFPFRVVYQFETQLDIAATSGTGETNSSQSNVVKGALTSRNTYIGLASDQWGAVKFGKTDSPYKNSTMRMNPFYGMIGDYQVIMGNTGGDNRVEFGTRLDHSLWYESPVLHNLSVNALYSPGQNRATNSDNLASGESDCTGGNVPGSGGITPVTCSDGSFSDAVSASLTYAKGRLYITSAYERHMKVNRSSDIVGIYGSANAYSAQLAAENVADEDAAKVGAQYVLPSQTTLSGIFESMHRYVPSELKFQNERQRMGSWMAISQKIDRETSLHFGWAHAFRAPGDPGQHNNSYNTPPGGVPGTDFTAGSNANNSANLFTLALKHQLTSTLGVYSNWATTINGPAAHYDLGAGGRSITTDCHDAYAAAGGLVGSNPHCFTGGTLQGASVGMLWKF